MNILISGCSFTQWPNFPGGPNSCWPKYLQDLDPDKKYTSLAEAAAGNQYICSSVINAILENPNKYDHVLVMWSGVSRLDFLTDVSNSAWNELIDSYGFFRKLPGNKLGWIFSGGHLGTWYKSPVAHKMFEEQYKVSNDLSLAHTNLIEMVKLQNFLENQKIPYHFMSYVNYWGHGQHLSPNGDFGLADHPELAPLVNSIDFSRWIFNNGKDGIYELAKELNNFQEDGFHPGDMAHQQWAEIVFNTLSRT